MAREAGARTLGGVAMVVRVIAASFKLYTGEEPPIELMFDEVRKLAKEHEW